MRIAYIAAGAAGMYCGSCIHDNTLAAALRDKGHDVTLIPTYTPLRTDEPNVSIDHVFMGGINIYLRQKFPFFRRSPRVLDWLLDRTVLLKLAARLGSSTDPKDLGALAVSILKGEEGHQGKEMVKLVDWLVGALDPEIVQLTNSMFVGMAGPIKRKLRVPVLSALQGEDLFLEGLVEPYRSQALDVLRRRLRDVDGFIAPSTYYADFMSGYLDIPRERIHVVRLGLNLKGHGESAGSRKNGSEVIGYLARICPEKGLHLLAESFRLLCRESNPSGARLRVAGYLGKGDRPYFQEVVRKLTQAGLRDRFDYWGEVDRVRKIEFLNSIDVFSVPTIYRDPKGLSVLEAMANAVPVVQPDHGSFPELVKETGGGVLVDPGSPEALASAIQSLLKDPERRKMLGRRGQEAVFRTFSSETMAEASLAVYRQYASPSS